MYRGCFRDVSGMLEVCFRDIFGMMLKCFRDIPRCFGDDFKMIFMLENVRKC